MTRPTFSRRSSALRLCTTALSTALSLASTTTAASRRTAVGAHPGARKVWLAVSRARRRRSHDHIALRIARDACFLILGPLRSDRD